MIIEVEQNQNYDLIQFYSFGLKFTKFFKVQNKTT